MLISTTMPNPVKWEKVEVVIMSIMEAEEILEAEVEEIFEEDDVATLINGKTIITTISTITMHNIKEEVETISVLAFVEEVGEIIIKRGQIMLVFIVENLGIK
jgi:hypothetical protein